MLELIGRNVTYLLADNTLFVEVSSEFICDVRVL